MDFVENLEMTRMVRGGKGRSRYLHHYDVLRTLIDMWLAPYILTLL